MIEKVSLFSSKRDYFLFTIIIVTISTYALLIEFNNYKQLTRFNSSLISAKVQKTYLKTKVNKKGKTKIYKVLKLKAKNGFTFYTSCKSSLNIHAGQKIDLEIWAGKITFYEYMSNFYSFSKVIFIDKTLSDKRKLNITISGMHDDKSIANIYQALYTAKPLNQELQTKLSTLGISHLIAISGFHLGVLSTILFFLLKYPYKFFQNRYFPYRNYKLDSFVLITIILLIYLLFLNSPPSLLRSFTMFFIGFILYDRGIKVISMQTLFLTTILLLAIFPRLFLSIGFWLSISGVFYIFLFLINFKNLSKIWRFILLPFWVYLLMLPFSISIFGNFSIYHPLSILWTSLFTIFYPLSILLHFIGFGNLLDGILKMLLNLDDINKKILISNIWLFIHISLSFLALWKKIFLKFLIIFTLIFLLYLYTAYLSNNIILNHI